MVKTRSTIVMVFLTIMIIHQKSIKKKESHKHDFQFIKREIQLPIFKISELWNRRRYLQLNSFNKV